MKYKFIPTNDITMFEIIAIMKALEFTVDMPIYDKLGRSKRHFHLMPPEEVFVEEEVVEEVVFITDEEEEVEEVQVVEVEKPSPPKKKSRPVDFGRRL